MMKKIIKITIIALCITCTLYSNKVYADASIGFGRVTRNSGSSSGSSSGTSTPNIPGKRGLPTVSQQRGNKKYMCEYNRKITPHTTITMNSYDMSGKPLMNGNILVNNIFTSGTWIGLRTQEIKTVDWEVYINNIGYYEMKKTYQCIYETTITTSRRTTCAKYKQINCVDNLDFPNYNICGTNGITDCTCIKMNNSNKFRCTYKTGCVDDTSNCEEWNYINSNDIAQYYGPAQDMDYYGTPSCESGVWHDGHWYTYKGTTEPQDKDPVQVTTDSTGDFAQYCKNEALSDTKKTAKSYVGTPTSELKILDLNRYNQGNTDNYPNSQSESNKLITYDIPYTPGNLESEENNYSGWYKKVYTFKPSKVCMNSITGKVRYIYEGTENCKSGELDVTTGKSSELEDGKYYEFWRYFIPLNTLSGKSFYIKYEKSGKTNNLDEDECRSVMQNYPLENSYPYRIYTKNEEKFTGSKKIDMEKITNEKECIRKVNGRKENLPVTSNDSNNCTYEIEHYPSINDYTNYIKKIDGTEFSGDNEKDLKSIEEKGCMFSTKVSFEVEQGFYNQITGQEILKGYNMYFRQIDVNKPFPNGITSSTYWNGIYNKTDGSVTVKMIKKDGTPDTVTVAKKLETGFDNPTYIANVASAAAINTIRNHNETTPYSSWGNQNENTNDKNKMFADGHSGFISQNTGIFTRKNASYYSLGCGPSNYDWEGCHKS